MVAIKHADAELEHFIAPNQLEELLWLPENTLGHYWMGASDHWRWMTVEWSGDHMVLESLVNLGPAPMENTLNHDVVASCFTWLMALGVWSGAINHVKHFLPTLSNTSSTETIRVMCWGHLINASRYQVDNWHKWEKLWGEWRLKLQVTVTKDDPRWVAQTKDIYSYYIRSAAGPKASCKGSWDKSVYLLQITVKFM